MSATSHTPGPWVLKGEVRRVGDTYHYCADIYDGRPSKGYRGTVAMIQTSDHLTHGMRVNEGKANASLIAAAPDLLEALDKLLTLTVFELGSNADREPWKRNIERSRAAIAKADPASLQSLQTKEEAI